jgi:hypothetical protein
MSHGDQALFKCRAVHYYQVPGGPALVRVLVHNSSLCSEQKGLIAAWNCDTGDFVADQCTELSWQPTLNEEDTVTTTFPDDANRLRDDRKRFGGIACACYYEVMAEGGCLKRLIATGHMRDVDGRTMVRLWDAQSGRLEASLCGPIMPTTNSFSTAGILQVSVSQEWVVAACADGRVHCWERHTGHKVAVFSSDGIVAGTTDLGSGGLSEADVLPPSRKNSNTCPAITVSSTGYVVAAFVVNGASKKQQQQQQQPPANNNNNNNNAPVTYGGHNKHTTLELFQLRKVNTSNQVKNMSAAAAASTTEVSIVHCGALPDLIDTVMGSLEGASKLPSSSNNDATRDENNQQREGLINGTTTTSTTLNSNSLIDRSTLKVNKIALDLERRGKIIVACGAVGSEIHGQPMNGFLAEYNFLKAAPLVSSSSLKK